ALRQGDALVAVPVSADPGGHLAAALLAAAGEVVAGRGDTKERRLQDAGQGDVGGLVDAEEGAGPGEVAPEKDGAGQTGVRFQAGNHGLARVVPRLDEVANDEVRAEIDAAGLAPLSGGDVLQLVDQLLDAPRSTGSRRCDADRFGLLRPALL